MPLLSGETRLWGGHRQAWPQLPERGCNLQRLGAAAARHEERAANAECWGAVGGTIPEKSSNNLVFLWAKQ